MKASPAWKEDPVWLMTFRCYLAIVKPLGAFIIGFLEPIGVETAFETASLIRGSYMRDLFSVSTTVLEMLLLFSL